MFSRQLHLDQHRLLGAHDYGVTPTPKTRLLKKKKKKGWAIPKWKKFRYSEKQKRIVMQYFQEGEQTGIKRTTE